MVRTSFRTNLVIGVLFVAIGCGLVFVGFELAAYEKTIADREVETTGSVVDYNVYRLPDGNYSYWFDYEYRFDQEAEITDQGIEELYPHEMNRSQTYVQRYDGGKSSTRSSAERSMKRNWEDDAGTVKVYVDPFYPADGSISDATTRRPMMFQYGGSVMIAIGLMLVATMARRVSA